MTAGTVRAPERAEYELEDDEWLAGNFRQAQVPTLNVIGQEALQRHRVLSKQPVQGLLRSWEMRTEWSGCWGYRDAAQ